MADETTQVQCSRCAHKKVCNLRGDFEMIFRQLNNYRVQVYEENQMNLIPLRNYDNIVQPIQLNCKEFLHENAHYNVRGETR